MVGWREWRGGRVGRGGVWFLSIVGSDLGNGGVERGEGEVGGEDEKGVVGWMTDA